MQVVGSHKILFLGADWWGSDARALAMSLRKQGHLLTEVNYEDYFPQSWSGTKLKVARKLLRNACEREFNNAVVAQLDNSAIDFMLVFKGMLLHPETLLRFSEERLPAYCFYPDVGFAAYGRNITQCLPLYECVFTTKRFHLADKNLVDRLRDIRFVSHGYDPDVHRSIQLSPSLINSYGCDVSFVGVWSSEKELWLATISSKLPDLRLQIWGNGWKNASRAVRKHWQGRGAYGDELAIICGASKVNLGLLTGKHADSVAGDQVTARTWQIPACGGFLLHEKTEELAEYFDIGTQVDVFSSTDDLVEKVKYYVSHHDERLCIATAGRNRAVCSNYTYAKAAEAITDYHADRRCRAPRPSQI